MKNNNKNFRRPPDCEAFSEAFRYFWEHGIGNRLDRNGDPVPWKSTDLEDAFEDIGSNISQRSIEKWLSGQVNPSRSNAHKIARIAGCGDDRQKEAWADCFIRGLSAPKTRTDIKTMPDLKTQPAVSTTPVETEEVFAKSIAAPDFEPPASAGAEGVAIPGSSAFARPVKFKALWLVIIAGLIAASAIFISQRQATAASAPPVRIGIKAFANNTDDRAGDYILSGLRSDLGYSLSQLDEATLVTPRELSSGDAKLQAEFLIDGALETDDDRPTIKLRLVESGSGKQLWARSFDPEFFSVSEINSVTLGDVGSAIGLKIPKSRLAEIVQFGTADPEAHTAYLKGRHLLKNWHETRKGDDIWLANKYFDEALESDAGFGLAAFHSADAFYHAAAGDIGDNPYGNKHPDLSPLEQIQRAMQLAGQSAQTPTQKAQAGVNYIFFSDDWSNLSGAVKTFAQDAQEERGELEWFFGPVTLLVTRQYSDLRDLVDNRMARFDPLNGTVHAYKARSALISGNYDEAERILREASVNSFSSRMDETKGYLLIAQRNARELSGHLETSEGLSALHRDYFQAMQFALEGHTDKALAKLTSSEALKDESLHLAIGLAKLGEVEASEKLMSKIENEEIGIQKVAVGIAYGAACGSEPVEFGPKYTGRLRDANLGLPACIGFNPK